MSKFSVREPLCSKLMVTFNSQRSASDEREVPSDEELNSSGEVPFSHALSVDYFNTIEQHKNSHGRFGSIDRTKNGPYFSQVSRYIENSNPRKPGRKPEPNAGFKTISPPITPDRSAVKSLSDTSIQEFNVSLKSGSPQKLIEGRRALSRSKQRSRVAGSD